MNKQQNPSAFSSTYEIQKIEQPTSWRMVKQNTGEETVSEEAVFILQGVIMSKDLPPLREKPK